MKVRQLMTPRPLTAGREDAPQELARLMEAAQVHHLPLIEGERVTGIWVSSEDGPKVLLGPEAVHETTPEADAEEAVEALLAGSEAVLAWEDGRPAGVITRADVMCVLRAALARGMGERTARPVVLRLVGPAGAGKTTLLLRSLELLDRCRTVVVQANSAQPASVPVDPSRHRIIDAPQAHWRRGLREVVDHVSDADLVLVEDLDGEPAVGRGIGEDLLVLVVPADAADRLEPDALREARAVVITRLEEAPAADLAGLRERMRGANPRLEVIAVARADDEEGLARWRDWLERRVLPRMH